MLLLKVHFFFFAALAWLSFADESFFPLILPYDARLFAATRRHICVSRLIR